MIERRTLPFLLFAAVLLLPSPSWSHGSSASTASLSGTINRIAGGIDVSITNNGPDSTNWVWIRMVPSVHHTGATMEGGGCGPGGDDNTVRCGIGAPGFQVGSTHVVTIKTDGPYPPNGGAQLFTSQVFSGPLVPAGTATGPAPTTPPTTSTTTAPCKCTSLTARIVPSSISLEAGPGLFGHGPSLTVEFAVHWSLSCSGGTGVNCKGTVEPTGREYTVVGPGDKEATLTKCRAPCGRTRNGVRRYGYNTRLDRAELAKAGKLTIVIRRTCQREPLPPVRLWIAFDRVGRVSLAKSRLG